jgi:hypothetical protein
MSFAWLALVAANICLRLVRVAYDGRKQAVAKARAAASAATQARQHLASLVRAMVPEASGNQLEAAEVEADKEMSVAEMEGLIELANAERGLRAALEARQAAAKQLEWFDADNVHCSGAQIEAGKLWVFITPSFDHANLPHIVNNMIMFVLCAPELEHQIGTAMMVVVYLSTGAAGWLRAAISMGPGGSTGTPRTPSMTLWTLSR